jgi:hypothetical protein
MSHAANTLFKRMSYKPDTYNDVASMAPYTKEERQFLVNLQVFLPEDVLLFQKRVLKVVLRLTLHGGLFLKKIKHIILSIQKDLPMLVMLES